MRKVVIAVFHCKYKKNIYKNGNNIRESQRELERERRGGWLWGFREY